MNTQTENTQDSAPSTQHLDAALPAGRPLSRLLELSERQREHVDAWLKERVPLRKIVELCTTEFQKEIPYMTFVRYSNRTYSTRQIEELADSKEVAVELSRYAATGNPSFSANTLEIFEQMAFDLAVAYNRDHDADDLAIVKQLWPLIHCAKNTTVRERHAAVQEDKCKLRAEELALKRELHQARLDGRRSCNADNLSARSRDAINPNDAASADLTSTNAGNPSASADSKSEMEVAPKRFPTPNPLPLEIVIENRRYTEKLLAGLVDPDTGEELPDPNESSENLSTLNHQLSTSESTSLQNGGAL